MTTPNELPAHDQLADDQDELDWDVKRDGRMADHATTSEDAEPITVPWEG